MDNGPSVGPPSPCPHSQPPSALADPQPLPVTQKQHGNIRREGLTVAAVQVHEGEVWSQGVLLHARLTSASRVSNFKLVSWQGNIRFHKLITAIKVCNVCNGKPKYFHNYYCKSFHNDAALYVLLAVIFLFWMEF